MTACILNSGSRVPKTDLASCYHRRLELRNFAAAEQLFLPRIAVCSSDLVTYFAWRRYRVNVRTNGKCYAVYAYSVSGIQPWCGLCVDRHGGPLSCSLSPDQINLNSYYRTVAMCSKCGMSAGRIGSLEFGSQMLQKGFT
jgi:hypothetical protein